MSLSYPGFIEMKQKVSLYSQKPLFFFFFANRNKTTSALNGFSYHSYYKLSIVLSVKKTLWVKNNAEGSLHFLSTPLKPCFG